MGLIVETRNLSKSYRSGAQSLMVLEDIALQVGRGEILSIVGTSGAGKSTLLHVIGTLIRPTSGDVWIDGEDVFQLSDHKLSRFRNERIGFVFQFHHLLPEFSAEENIMLPLLIGGESESAARKRARELLHAVSLESRASHHPSELSGGEQQRIAVARALATKPAVVLADEPSGNLDEDTSEELHQVIWDVREETGQAFVIVTHDPVLADRADRKVVLHAHRLAGDASPVRVGAS